MPLLHPPELLLQDRADAPRVREHRAGIEQTQGRVPRGGRQVAAAKCGAPAAGQLEGRSLRNISPRGHDRDRIARTQALAGDEDVRQDTGVLERPHRPCAAVAGEDLVSGGPARAVLNPLVRRVIVSSSPRPA